MSKSFVFVVSAEATVNPDCTAPFNFRSSVKLNCGLAEKFAPAGLYPSLYVTTTAVPFTTSSCTTALESVLLLIKSIVRSIILTLASPLAMFVSISPLASLSACEISAAFSADVGSVTPVGNV